MHPSLLMLTALLLVTPLAAAGGIDAGVDYFTPASGGCSDTHRDSYESGGFGYYDNETGAYWTHEWSSSSSSWTESCRESYDTVGASLRTDEADLASARVGGSNSTYSDQRYETDGSRYSSYQPIGNGSYRSDSSSWSSSSHWSGGSSWARDVEARAAGERVVVGRGCSQSHSSTYGSTYSWGSSDFDGAESSYEQSESSDVWTYRNTCRDGASAAGAGAGRVDGCASTYSYERDGYSYSGSYGAEGERSSGESTCRSGVAADGAGLSAFAGSRSSCSDTSHSWSWWDSTNGTSGSRSQSACENAPVAVEGPDGMTILIGTWSANETHCDGDDCWTHSGSRGGVVLAWAHNPLGPGDFSLTQPLP